MRGEYDFPGRSCPRVGLSSRSCRHFASFVQESSKVSVPKLYQNGRIDQGAYEAPPPSCLASDPVFVAGTATGGSPLDNPIGTGPFQLDQWSRGDSIIFSAFEDYWGDKPSYGTLVFRWATEGAARLL